MALGRTSELAAPGERITLQAPENRAHSSATSKTLTLCDEVQLTIDSLRSGAPGVDKLQFLLTVATDVVLSREAPIWKPPMRFSGRLSSRAMRFRVSASANFAGFDG